MSNSYSHACLTVDCTLAEGKILQSVLTLLRNEMEGWSIAPTDSAALPDEAADWPEWAKQFCVELAQDSFENERDHLSFESVLALTTVQGRPVESEQNFHGLILEGDNIEDDLFVAAHLILKALDSQQLISTGTAYTADEADDTTYSGNHVTITRHGWEFLIDCHDVIAAEAEAGQNVGYWLITWGNQAAIWITDASDTPSKVVRETWSQHFSLGIPADLDPADLNVKRIPGTVFRHIKDALPVFNSASVASRLLTQHTESAA